MSDAWLGALFEGRHPALAAEVLAWARASRRVRAFFEGHHTKIRAKLKAARDADTLADLRAELEAAVLLLADARLTLAYEPYAAAKARSPDFAVTFKAHTLFHVEVRRLRPASDDSTRAAKLLTVLADKLHQLPPSSSNVLWLATDQPFSALGLWPNLRVAAADDAWRAQHGYASASTFARQLARLSAVVERTPGALAPSLNPQARHPLPNGIANALLRLR